MPLPATVDDFDDLSAWTVSGLSVASNLVSATVGGTWGTAKMTDGPTPTNGPEHRICFDVIPDKTDTAGRLMYVGSMDSAAAAQGMGAGYIAGTGIVAMLQISDALSSGHVAVADADITTGRRYHVEMCYRPRYTAGDWTCIIQVYDTTTSPWTFVGGVQETALNAVWANFDDFAIAGDSDATTISRVALEPGPAGCFPSATTEPYMTGTAFTWRETGAIDVGDANKQFGIYVPGVMRRDPSVVCIHCHGVGTWTPSQPTNSSSGAWDRATLNAQSNVVFSMLDAGIPVIALRQYSGTGTTSDSWASPDALTETSEAVSWVQDQLGVDTKFLIYGYSMGGLHASRLITEGTVPNVIGVYLHNPIFSLFNAWNNGSFQAGLEAAWGISPADASEAHTELDPFDPALKVDTNPGRWAGKYILLTTSDDDSTASKALHGGLLATSLTDKGVPFTHYERPFGSHVDVPGDDAAKFISESLEIASAPSLRNRTVISL